MKFLLDENLPRKVAALFRQKGHQVEHVLDSPLRGSQDETLAAYALENNYAIVTSDIGFADIRHYSPLSYHGIIVFRFRDDMELTLIAHLTKSVLQQISLMPEITGRLIIVEENQIRVR